MFQRELLRVHSLDPIEQTTSGVQIIRYKVNVGRSIIQVWKTFWPPEPDEELTHPESETASRAEQEAFHAEEEALRAGEALIIAKAKAASAREAIYDSESRTLANEYFARREQILAAPQIILVHDVGLSGALWYNVALWLAEQGVVVHVPTLPGHGAGEWKSVGYAPRWTIGSGETYGPCGLADYLNGILSLIESIRSINGGLSIGGVGIGGIVAQLCARSVPCTGLALIGSCLPHRASLAWRRWTYTPADLAAVDPGQVSSISKRVKDTRRGRGLLDLEPFSAASNDFKDPFKELMRQGQQSVQASRFLVIAGEHDAMLSRDELEATAAFYHVPLTVIASAGHLPMVGEHERQVAAKLFALTEAR